MSQMRYSMTRYRDERFEVTLDELARAAGVHPDLVGCFVDFGLIEPVASAGDCVYFDSAAVPRLFAITRLRRDIGANLASIAVILELVERIQSLEHENLALRAGR